MKGINSSGDHTHGRNRAAWSFEQNARRAHRCTERPEGPWFKSKRT